MAEYVDEKKLRIANAIKIDGITANEIYEMITVPQDMNKGDYALPCFRFAKTFGKAPKAVAELLAVNINSQPENGYIAEAVDGYLNFRLDKLKLADEILTAVLKQGEKFGNSSIGQGKTVCIDYSSVNIAKPFHIGHLSTTVIGGALYRIYKKLSYNTVGINHLGDWGTQFGKLIVAYKMWGDRADIEARGVTALNELYVRFHREAENNEELNEEARKNFKRIEDGDAEALELFALFKRITLEEAERVYKRLDIKFDSYNGEAFYNDKMGAVLDELEKKNLIIESDGAKVVDLSEYNMPPCLLVKADGATLYATRDLAAAFYRKKTYDFYKCLYVVAYQQNLHFKQFFKVLELMDMPWYDRLIHVPFGMVSLQDGAMSTRKGNVVLLKDVLDRAVEKSFEIISEKSAKLPNKEEVSEKVGVGAVVFFALSNNRIKDIVFSYDKVLNFDGETGPYVQYTNARAASILRNAGDISYVFNEPFTADELKGVDNRESEALISLIGRMPQILSDAAEKYEPSILTRHIIDVAKAFNRFYLSNRILNAESEYRKARIALVYATKTVITEGLRLLGINAPEEM